MSDKKNFPADIDSLGPIKDFIRASAKSNGLSKDRIYCLALAIEEIFVNIINHAYKYQKKEAVVGVELLPEETCFTVIMSDDSSPFDPTKEELPDKDDLSMPLEERSLGGMGIFIATTSVDELSYKYVNGKNINTFTINKTSK